MEVIKGSHRGGSAQFHGSIPFRPYRDKSGMVAALRKHSADFATPIRTAIKSRTTLDAAGDTPGEGAYAGDVSPSYAFEILKAEASAELVDVRTKPEWAFVGVPDLSGLGKATSFIEWLNYPTMNPNEMFLTELERAIGKDKDAAVFFLCRSGQRSRKAAIAATEQGFARAYNVEGGFEGSLDVERHRARTGGWKVEGLPWGQT